MVKCVFSFGLFEIKHDNMNCDLSSFYTISSQEIVVNVFVNSSVFIMFTLHKLKIHFSHNKLIANRYILRVQKLNLDDTAWKVYKCEVISGPYFSVFGPEITPYLDTFHAVWFYRCFSMIH